MAYCVSDLNTLRLFEGAARHLSVKVEDEEQGVTRTVVSFFFQAEDGIRDIGVTGVQTCALPISLSTVRAPRRLARVSAAKVSCGRISFWHRTVAPGPSSWSGTCAAAVSRLAPLATMIAFSPASSTPITAIAVGRGETASSSQSIPAATRSSRTTGP